MTKTRIPALDDWQFTPEGGVVHQTECTAVIADVHLGYEWARGGAGDCVLAHSFAETITRLSTLLNRFRISRLIIAGDLVESARPCPSTARDLERLDSWLTDRGVNLQVLEGNHDVRSTRTSRTTRANSPQMPRTCKVGGWTIGHGHRQIKGAARICGHHHPVFHWQGIKAPCFLAGPRQIVLPAFSQNAAGRNVLSGTLCKEWLGNSVRCLVSVGTEVLDFGPLTKLRGELGQRA